MVLDPHPSVGKMVESVRDCGHGLSIGATIIKLQLNVAKWKLDPILPELPIFPENFSVYIF